MDKTAHFLADFAILVYLHAKLLKKRTVGKLWIPSFMHSSWSLPSAQFSP